MAKRKRDPWTLRHLNTANFVRAELSQWKNYRFVLPLPVAVYVFVTSRQANGFLPGLSYITRLSHTGGPHRGVTLGLFMFVLFLFLIFFWFRMPLPSPETTVPLIGKDILGSCAHSTQPSFKEFKAYTRFRPLSTARS